MDNEAPPSLTRQIADAIKGSDLAAIDYLIGRYPDQLHFHTPFGWQTWLGYAAGYAELVVVQKLLSLGFDVNEGTPGDSRKPLCLACDNGRLDVATCLLDSGATMDTATSIQNPLFAAIVGRSREVTELLLRRGIDASVRYNSKTMKNMDAMAFALMQGETECARTIALWNAKGDEAAARTALEFAANVAEDNAYGPRAAAKRRAARRLN